MNAIAVSLF